MSSSNHPRPQTILNQSHLSILPSQVSIYLTHHAIILKPTGTHQSSHLNTTVASLPWSPDLPQISLINDWHPPTSQDTTLKADFDGVIGLLTLFHGLSS